MRRPHYIYTELKNDPEFKKLDPIVFKEDVYDWVLISTEDPDTGNRKTMYPDEITADDYRNFYEDISVDDIEDEDWGEEVW